jgi:predicted sulfurtransferase
MKILNISGYKFILLPDAEILREKFLKFCREIAINGTVIFSPEGINIGVAGTCEKISIFINELKKDSRFADMIFKESFSEEVPFQKMLVKLKKMLVPSAPGIDPNQLTGKRLDPVELKKWLDERREVVLIDTRNTYEFDQGSFENAINLNIENFSDLDKALKKLPEDLREKPVVMFCTGGIRCEKATPIAMKSGFSDVYQLEGGILDYFKACDGAHWQGGCFVFDDRLALKPSLTSVLAG